MSEYICPHCKKPIYDDEAILCLYCGESLKRGSVIMGRLRYSKPKVIIVVVLLLILVSFFMLILR